MAEQERKQVRISSKADTQQNWDAHSDYVLLEHEVGYVSDTGRFKIGDGVTPWAELPYNEMVGKISDANGTILNDETNNVADGLYSLSAGETTKALSRNAAALGGQTIAGGRGFKITDCSGPNPDGSGYYTFIGTEIEDIELGVDRYSVRLSSAKYDVGVILDAQVFGNGITELLVSNYPNIPIEPEDVTDSTTYTVENYLTIVGKPEIGNIDIGFNAHAEGEKTIAQDRDAHVEGRGAKAIGQYAHAEGRDTVAAYAAHAEGRGTKAMGNMAHAEGQNTKALGERTHAEGATTEAIGNNSHAEGQNTKAMGHTSHAEGWGSMAAADVTHAEGIETKAYGYGSHSEGNKTEALGVSSHAEGQETKANGNNAHAEGYGTVATEPAAHAEGLGTQANGIGSHAEGHQTIAEGTNSHAEGQQSQAIGNLSHAEGYNTTTFETATAAHAEGSGAQAIGSATHAEGQDTIAEGYSAHAEGIGSKAQGTGSHAAGLNTIAKGDYQTTIGKFNVEDPTMAFIIGNGENNSARDNALMVDWDGNMALAGRVIPSDYTNLDERYLKNVGDIGAIMNYCGELSDVSELPETADNGDIYIINKKSMKNCITYTGRLGDLIQCETEESLGIYVTGNPNALLAWYVKLDNIPAEYTLIDTDKHINQWGGTWCAVYNSTTGRHLGILTVGESSEYPRIIVVEDGFGVTSLDDEITLCLGLRVDPNSFDYYSNYGFVESVEIKTLKSTYCWTEGSWALINSGVYDEIGQIIDELESNLTYVENRVENKVEDGGFLGGPMNDITGTIYTYHTITPKDETIKYKLLKGKFSDLFNFYYDDPYVGKTLYQLNISRQENLEYFDQEWTYVYNPETGEYVNRFYCDVTAGTPVEKICGYTGNDDDLVSLIITNAGENVQFNITPINEIYYAKDGKVIRLKTELDEETNGADLPTVTLNDNGKFLRVVDGEWAADSFEVSIPDMDSNNVMHENRVLKEVINELQNKISALETAIGSIDTALTSILTMQDELIGGDISMALDEVLEEQNELIGGEEA